MTNIALSGRISLAVIVGYFLAVVISILFSYILMFVGLSKVDATLWAQISSFLIYSCLIIWVFSVDSLKKITIQSFTLLIAGTIIIYLLKKFAS